MAMFWLDNPEQFISLVNLLFLRYRDELQSAAEEELDDNDVCGDDFTVGGGEEGEFKQRFLDRFAEMMSREKGGKHACSVALREYRDQRVDQDVKISLIVARTAAFKNVDEQFRCRLENLLAAIGMSVYNGSNDISVLKAELWEALLCYNQPRLDRYTDSLRVNLESFKAAGSLDCIPPYHAPRPPQNDDSEHKTFCDDYFIGPYSKATHVDYMKLAQKSIVELDAILHTSDRATQRRLLAEHTYSICHMKSLRTLINSFPNVSVGHRLLSDILSLGRLRLCYLTLIKGALSIPGFAHLSLIFVKNPPRRVCPATLPPLEDVMQLLGLLLNATSVNYFISEKLDVIGAKRAFRQLQNGISRQHLPTHVELQLVFHIIRTMDIQTVAKEVYPYIGSSKPSCFLCSAFLNSLDRNGVAFKTRGTHGRICAPWSIPDVDGLSANMVIVLRSIVNEIRYLLVREIVKPITITSHRVEFWLHQNLLTSFPQGGPPDFLAVARPYLSPADREKEPHQLVPEAKSKSFMLYALLLNGCRLDPSIHFDAISKDLYFDFGFVTGCGSEGEQLLHSVYRSLISKCSFREFWTAFQSNTLVALMDAKGLGPMHKGVRHFESFMTIGRNHWCPTVWLLKSFVNFPDTVAPLSVTVDYGFFNCKTAEEVLSLKEVYRDLFTYAAVDPLELHVACTRGKLYDFARAYKPYLQPRFKRLMTNIYPLYNNTGWAGTSPSYFWYFVLFFFLSISAMYLSGRVPYPMWT